MDTHTLSDFIESIDSMARTIDQPRTVSSTPKDGEVVTRAYRGGLALRVDPIQHGLDER